MDKVSKLSVTVGQFKYDIFEYAMTPLILKQQNNPKELERLFAILDVDGNKVITYDNLRKIARDSGENFTEDELKDIIFEADTDKDGALNFREFSS